MMRQSKTESAVSALSLAGIGEKLGTTQWIAIVFAVAISAVLFGASGSDGAYFQAFEFHYNPYAWLALIAVVVNLTLLILIGKLKAKSDEIVWFSMFITCLFAWATAEFFVRISAGPTTFLFWNSFMAVPVMVMPITLYMFALSYTNPKQARHIWTIIPLFGAAACLIMFDLRTGLIDRSTEAGVIPTPWNGLVQPGPYHNVIGLWIFALAVLGIVLLAQFRRRTLEPMLRKQAGLFIVALMLPLVFGILSETILPAIGVTYLEPFEVVTTAVTGVIIAFGVMRYRLLALDSLLVAENILETINEAVIGVDPELGITYANHGAQRLLGYSQKQFSKLRFTDFLSQGWDEKALKQVLFGTEGTTKKNEFDSIDLQTASGKVVTAKLSVSIVVGDGGVEGHLIVATDISQMARAAQVIEHTVEDRTREVQETKATLVASINSIKLGFIITDHRPEVIRVNTVAHDLFCAGHNNHPAGECHEVTIEKVQALMGAAFKITDHIAGCLKRQLPHEVKDVTFHERNWRLYFSPMVVERGSIGCAVLFQDTTEERLLERSRDEFFSIASHELRTPLTSIKGNSSLIMQYYKSVLKDEALHEMIADIHESSDRLIQIVNDFLDVSRLEQGRIEFHLEQLSISKVIEDVVYGMSALLKEKHLHIKLSGNITNLDALPKVLADKNRLKQIFFNLLGNAVKFTEKGSISISAEAKGDVIRIHVEDKGIGISDESQALLFRKFQQASDSILTRDSSHGTGLGLYISRLLAIGMGGKLGLETSIPGKGSTFYIEVPIVKPIGPELAAATRK